MKLESQKGSPTDIDLGQESLVAEVADFMTSTYSYMLETLSIEEWLENLARLTGADFTSSERWTMERPENVISSRHGSADPLRSGWRNWAEHIMDATRETKPFFLETDGHGKFGPAPLANGFTPDQVAIYTLDWRPARIVGAVSKSDAPPDWGSKTRKLLELMIPNMRASVELHKTLGRAQMLAALTTDILDSAPRGIVAVSPDGLIRFANAYAESMMADRDGVARDGYRLLLTDPTQQKSLEATLAELAVCTWDDMHKHHVDQTISRPSGRAAYHMMLRTLPIPDWRIETARSDRIATIYLHDTEKYERPSFDQLKSFYGLTTAEAKIAAFLYNGLSISSAAKQAGISINTGRTHLRNIFSKVGVKNQAELLARLTATLKYEGD